MDRIHLLDPLVADRIAAGEVVERPSSVVKELVENSLDAGATQILIEIDGAGSEMIRVSDNGVGMHPDDVRLAVQRFATSKITGANDLLGLQSLGFRGEALPSIAAISHMELTSALPGAQSGRSVWVDGGEVSGEHDVGAPRGTVVSVRHLFFNTPARRKFLKSPSREFALIVDTVQRLALARPGVSIRMMHEGEEVMRYPGGGPPDRAAAVLGEAVVTRSLPLETTVGEIGIRGWIGRPELARGSRRQQFVFVNDRPVQNRIISSAAEQAYTQIVPVGTFPAFVLFVTLPLHRVDVNVHPRKLEVRFDDEHQIFGAVHRAVRETLRAAQLIRQVEAQPLPSSGIAMHLGMDSERVTGHPPTDAPTVAMTGRLPELRILGQLQRTYLLAQRDSGLVVIDQHAAHERVLYERMLKARQRGLPIAQVLIEPLLLTLSGAEAAILDANTETFAHLGFDLEPFGDRTVLIRSIPQVAASSSAETLLRDLLAEAAEGARLKAAQDRLERLTITTACRTAVRAGDPLTAEQIVQLVRDLAATDDPFTCFHGRPTMVTFSREQVERWFLRT